MTTLILGHRGAPFMAPENTLPSFRAALSAGADGVELDVRLSADGTLVVCHDPTLDRLASAAVRVGAVSMDALKYWKISDKYNIPTLLDVLTIAQGKLVNIEIKTDDGDPKYLAIATHATLQQARRRKIQTNVIVSSFDPSALVALRRIDHSIPRGLLLPSEPLFAADILARSKAVAPHAIHPHHQLCNRATVSRWLALGIKVNVWTVDSPDQIARMIRLGVTSVITNVPDVAVGIRGTVAV